MTLQIAVINAVTLNGGDAAILEGLRRILRSAFGPNAQMVVFDQQAKIASRYYPETEFRQMYFPGKWRPSWYLQVARRLRIAGGLQVLEQAFWLVGAWLLTCLLNLLVLRVTG
jgi:hypothetical protein